MKGPRRAIGGRLAEPATNSTPIDTTLPSAPGKPVISNIFSQGSPILSFSASADNLGVLYYAAYLDASTIEYARSSTTTIVLADIPAGSHSVVVRAFDVAGNMSNASDQTNFVIPDFSGKKLSTSSIFRNAAVRVVLFGPSTADPGDCTYPANMNEELTSLAFPASGTIGATMTGTRWRLPEVYPQAFLVRNCGIGGATSTTMLARDVSLAGVTRRAITDILDAAADVVILRGTAINSFYGLTAAQLTDALFNAELGRFSELLSRMSQVGSLVICEGDAGVYQQGTTNANEVACQKFLARLNTAFKAAVVAMGNSNIQWADPVGVTCDANGAWLPKMSTDGLHPNYDGGMSIAYNLEAPILTQRFGISSDIRYLGANLSPNPLLLSTNTVASGTLATGFVLPILAGNVVTANAKVELIDLVWGLNGIVLRKNVMMQTVECTPNAVGSVYAALQAPMPAYSGWNANDKIGVEFYYFVKKLDGTAMPNPSVIAAVLSFSKTDNGTVQSSILNPTSAAVVESYAFYGKAILNPFQLLESGANLSASKLYLNVSLNAGDSIAANSFKMGVGGVRIVKL